MNIKICPWYISILGAMKRAFALIMILGIFAFVNAHDMRNSIRRGRQFNFSDLIPRDQKARRPSKPQSRDFIPVTPPEQAQFSDLIPARQIDPSTVIEGDVEDVEEAVFQEGFDDYIDDSNDVEENEVSNRAPPTPPGDDSDERYIDEGYGFTRNRGYLYPNKYLIDVPKSRKRTKLGFPRSAASNFVDNFRKNADWDELRSHSDLLRRSKRSHLSHLSHTRHGLPMPHDLPPHVAHDTLHREAVLAAMLQQRLLDTDKERTHNLNSHHFVEVASPAHHVSHGTATSGHHTAVHQTHHQTHDTHHAPIQHHSLAHSVASPHHGIQHHGPVHDHSHMLTHMKTIHPPAIRGYDPPVKGITLESVFGLSTKYHPAREPKYLVPETKYHVPDTKYHPPIKASYHAPKPKSYNPTYKTYKGDDYDYKKDMHGHPFSLEMIFGLPMHKYYMKQYGHMMHPKHHHGHHHPVVHPPKPHYVTPKPKPYHAPKPKPHYVTPKPEPYHAPKPEYHEPEPYHAPKPEYHEPAPAYHPTPAPKYHPTPATKYVEPHKPILQPDILYHEPKVIIPHHTPHPTAVYHEPKLLPAHPEPTYHAPIKPVLHHPPHHSTGYAPPVHGGSLEDIFHIKSKYSLPKKPPTLYTTPAPYHGPPKGYSPVAHHNSYASGYDYIYPKKPQNGYTLHYLPYEEYVPYHAETIDALHKNLPTVPGSAHILVPSPTPVIPHHPHGFQRESILPHHPIHHPLGAKRQKRSANQGQLSYPNVMLNEVDDVHYSFWKDTVDLTLSHRKGRPPSSVPFSLPNIKLKTRKPVPNRNNRPNLRKRPRPRGPRPASLKRAPSNLGKTTAVFPLCSETNRNDNKSACQLAGGQLRGPGGIVVRPPASHPVVQIHVNDMGKLPALAFYPADSTINRRAMSAIAATSSSVFPNAAQNNAISSNNFPINNANSNAPYNQNNAGPISAPLNFFEAPRNNPSSVQNNLNAISYIQPPQNNPSSTYFAPNNFPATQNNINAQSYGPPTQTNPNPNYSLPQSTNQNTQQPTLNNNYQQPNNQNFGTAQKLNQNSFSSQTFSPPSSASHVSFPRQPKNTFVQGTVANSFPNGFPLIGNAPNQQSSQALFNPSISNPSNPFLKSTKTSSSSSFRSSQPNTNNIFQAVFQSNPKNTPSTNQGSVNSDFRPAQPPWQQQFQNNTRTRDVENILDSFQPADAQILLGQFSSPLRSSRLTQAPTPTSFFGALGRLQKGKFNQPKKFQRLTLPPEENNFGQDDILQLENISKEEIVEQFIIRENALQELLRSNINQNEFSEPSTGNWKIRPNVASIAKTLPLAKMTKEQIIERFALRENALQDFLRKGLGSSIANEFKEPEQGVWNIRPTVSSIVQPTTGTTESRDTDLREFLRSGVVQTNFFEIPDIPFSISPTVASIHPTPAQTDLQKLFENIGRDRFTTPSTGVWNFKPSPTSPTIVDSNRDIYPTLTSLQKLFSNSGVNDFSPPSSGVWNIRQAAERQRNIQKIKVQNPFTLKSTDLKSLFGQTRFDIKAPQNPWKIVKPTVAPEVVSIQANDLKMMLSSLDTSTLSKQQNIQSIAALASTVAPTSAPRETITIRTSDLQRLFNKLENQNEYSAPKGGVWNIRQAANKAKQIDIQSIRELKDHVGEMVDKQEKRINEKGFMTPKERELMTELRDKEDTLGDLIRELERQPKQSIDFNSFTTASTFSASDFEQPVGGKWNFKQAFDEFTKKRQQAILEANQSNGPINVPPLRKGRVTPELVAALRASNFEPPSGGVWDFKSTEKLLRKFNLYIGTNQDSHNLDDGAATNSQQGPSEWTWSGQRQEWIRHGSSQSSGANQDQNRFQPVQTSNSDTVSQAEEDELKQLVLLHMQNSVESKLPRNEESSGEAPEGFLDDDYLVYEEDDEDYEQEFDSLSDQSNENLNSDGGPHYISNTKVINKAGYPQVVIIPHSVSDSNQFTLSLGKHKIGFETNKEEDIDDALVNPPNDQELRAPKEQQFSRLVQKPPVKDKDVNERRRQALLRASEKQELLLTNLLDAVERRKKDKENSQKHKKVDVTIENVVEEVIQRQMIALNGLKHSVEVVGGASNQPNQSVGDDTKNVEFVDERLKLLEDASHRQLEVLESLIDAVQRLDSDGFQNHDRLKNLETIAVHQSQMLEQLSNAEKPSATIPSDLDTAQTTIRRSSSPQTTVETAKIQNGHRKPIPKATVEHTPDDRKDKSDKKEEKINHAQMRNEMRELQKQLLLEQHKVHVSNMEAQRQAVRDELGDLADLIIHTRPQASIPSRPSISSFSQLEKLVRTTMSPQQRAATIALIKSKRPMLGKILEQTIPSLLSVDGSDPVLQDSITQESVQPTITSSKQANAWQQRFIDNFRLRKLQGRALNLNKRNHFVPKLTPPKS